MNEFDSLDRALFALPLEETPPGLRDAILAITIRAPRVAPLPVKPWETIFIGICTAFAVWLTYGGLTDPGIARQLTEAFASFGHILGNPVWLAWLAAGVSVAFSVSFLSSQASPAPLRRIRL